TGPSSGLAPRMAAEQISLRAGLYLACRGGGKRWAVLPPPARAHGTQSPGTTNSNRVSWFSELSVDGSLSKRGAGESAERVEIGIDGILARLVYELGALLADFYDRLKSSDVEALCFGLGVDFFDVVGGGLFLCFDVFDAADERFQRLLIELRDMRVVADGGFLR